MLVAPIGRETAGAGGGEGRLSKVLNPSDRSRELLSYVFPSMSNRFKCLDDSGLLIERRKRNIQ